MCMFFQREKIQHIEELFNVGVTVKANGLKLQLNSLQFKVKHI